MGVKMGKRKFLMTGVFFLIVFTTLLSFTACDGGSGTGDTVVTISAIPGVVVPVRNAVPDTTAIDTAQYTGTVSWSPADNPFAATTEYTANIVLTAKDGFTLNGVSADFFTVAGAVTVSNAVNSGVVSAVFPATGEVPDVDVTFEGVIENGGSSGTANSTSLVLTFDVDPTTLTADNITVTGATKGTLTDNGLTKSLAISNITVANGATVFVTVTSPAGYAITGSPQTAVVYRLLTIGMDYLGGKIVHILESSQPGYEAGVPHGLIVSSEDLNSGSGIIWALAGNQSTEVTGTGTAIGTGSANTDKIIDQNDPGKEGLITYAAGLARKHDGGGYSDWYLPSQDELKYLFWNRAEIGGLSGDYWNSSEDTGTNAHAQSLGNGVCFSDPKSRSYKVRAFRSF